ncbi:MAG: hypothetical protein AB7D19_11825, partial [Acetobacter sp.]|uniref:hypothetical protein n=1 Tax=Acetobacter sp. TaxID=440 RepID=UPI003D0436B2
MAVQEYEKSEIDDGGSKHFSRRNRQRGGAEPASHSFGCPFSHPHKRICDLESDSKRVVYEHPGVVLTCPENYGSETGFMTMRRYGYARVSTGEQTNDP